MIINNNNNYILIINNEINTIHFIYNKIIIIIKDIKILTYIYDIK